MEFASYQTAVDLPTVRRVLAVPFKRFNRGQVDHLSREEIQALLDATGRSTWSGKRDWILLKTLYNTGARVSKSIAMKSHLSTSAVRLTFEFTAKVVRSELFLCGRRHEKEFDNSSP